MTTNSPTHTPKLRQGFDLFLISFLILFLELAAIRWFPAHVLYLTFFTNMVLLSAFLGMSVGCLAAGQKRDYLKWTPLLLVIVMVAAVGVEASSGSFVKFVDVGNQTRPEQIYFGTEYQSQDLSRYAIPVEVLCAFFFLILALAFIGPGQELGRALKRWPNRLQAYSVNIAGSIAGILIFAACSWFQVRALWWFLLVAIGLGYFYFVSPTHRFQTRRIGWTALTALPLLFVIYLAAFVPTHNDYPGQAKAQQFWSPYYRIDFKEADLSLSVNLIYHQQMVSRNETFPAYALPHLLNRDAGRPAFADVMIIGAGSGNDVSRALQWGAKHVDAVEIDPAIYRLGQAHHPDQPYSDPRVEIHNDDGRNFLRATDRKYDLIIYALVDSLVLHSGYSNIRLESFLFTRQAFEDVRRHLKPNGTFVIYNYFRQGWLAARLKQGLDEVFGKENSIVLTLPYREVIEPESATFGDFTVFFAGDTGQLRNAFEHSKGYWLQTDQPPQPTTANGFALGMAPITFQTDSGKSGEGSAPKFEHFALATVKPPAEGIRTATDDWPFLYLRKPMIPTLSWRGMVIMGSLGLLLIWFFSRRQSNTSTIYNSLNLQLFFLGAGFMLIETKAVVTMALLFGGTWIVNSVVFTAILVMILLANLYTFRWKPANLWPYYTALVITLALNVIVSLDAFLGMSRGVQVLGSCLLVFTPIFFAGIIFAGSFRRSANADTAFGMNVAGAMLGGLAEYSSMALGFKYVVLIALLFYIFSAVAWTRARSSPLPGNHPLPSS